MTSSMIDWVIIYGYYLPCYKKTTTQKIIKFINKLHTVRI